MSTSKTSNESTKEKKISVSVDRQLSTTIIGFISMLAGLGLIVFGAMGYLQQINLETLTTNAPVRLDASIASVLLLLSGLILLIAGFGVWRTLFWSFYLFVAGFTVAIIFMLTLFRTNALTKIGIVATSSILGALLGESEYFRGRKSKEDIDVAFLVDFVVYGSISVGVVAILLGIASLVDKFILETGFFEKLLQQVTGENTILSNPLVIGIVVIIVGLVFTISGYGLSKEMSWAWYAFVVGFIVIIITIFLTSPLEMEFITPSVALLLIGISLGALIANYEYFTN